MVKKYSNHGFGRCLVNVTFSVLRKYHSMVVILCPDLKQCFNSSAGINIAFSCVNILLNFKHSCSVAGKQKCNWYHMTVTFKEESCALLSVLLILELLPARFLFDRLSYFHCMNSYATIHIKQCLF